MRTQISDLTIYLDNFIILPLWGDNCDEGINEEFHQHKQLTYKADEQYISNETKWNIHNKQLPSLHTISIIPEYIYICTQRNG